MLHIKKLILHKNNGNTTSLVIGQGFLFLMIVFCLFSFRLIMINTLFNYVDDGLTSSVLAAALVNVPEYGKSNQLIIHDDDKYIDTTHNAEYQGWNKIEADILLSELNYGSDITLKYDELDHKQTLDYDCRDHDADNTTKDMEDEYLCRSVSAFTSAMTHNLSNGLAHSTHSAENPVTNTSSLGGLKTGGVLAIDKNSIIDKSFLGSYITSDIEVNRMEIISVYREHLALRHLYASEYMLYSVGGKTRVKYDELDQKTINKLSTVNIEWNPDAPEDETQFENLYKPHPYVLNDDVTRSKTRVITDADYKVVGGLKVENESYASNMEWYKRKLAKFKKDRAKFTSGESLVCYTDTQVTYQGEYEDATGGYGDKDTSMFHYFFADSSGKIPREQDALTNAMSVEDGKTTEGKAPIDYWSVYCYDGTTTHFKGHDVNSADFIQPEIGTVGATSIMKGTPVENSAIYVELTFTIKTFPTMTGVGFNTLENTRKVQVVRLIDIELNTDL